MPGSDLGTEDDVWNTDLRSAPREDGSMSKVKWYAIGIAVWTLISFCNPGVWMVIYALV